MIHFPGMQAYLMVPQLIKYVMIHFSDMQAISDGFTAKKCIVIHFSDKQNQGSASKHNMHTLKI